MSSRVAEKQRLREEREEREREATSQAQRKRRLGLLGAAVLVALEQRARERGYPSVELHAQVHATAFYDKAGYQPYGEVYLEAGIEHLSMRKELA